jgi:hypothetical protein
MSRALVHRIIAGALTVVLLSLPATAEACTVCMGDVNSKTAGAMNAAIFLMIGFIGSMLASLAIFAVYLARRAAAPAPPYADLNSSGPDADPIS